MGIVFKRDLENYHLIKQNAIIAFAKNAKFGKRSNDDRDPVKNKA